MENIWGDLEYERVRAVQPNDVVIDAGASIGMFTAKASIQAGDSGVVYAFEPCPENFSWLKRNTEKLKNVRLFQKALWSSSGVKTLYINNGNFGGNSLYPLPPEQLLQSIDVETTTIDETVQGKVDFLKIDVEASEAELLMGAKETLRKYNPFIAIEIHSIPHYHMVNEYLKGFGYEPLQKTPSYGTMCWIPMPTSLKA